MKQKNLYKEHKHTLLVIFALSCIVTFFAFNRGVAFGSTAGISAMEAAGAPGGMVTALGGVFAPFIGASASPLLTLTVLSGVGNLLSAEIISKEAFPLQFSELLVSMPISRLGIFIGLFAITASKLLLSVLNGTKVFSDATLGKLENGIGKFVSVVVPFVVMSTTTVHAAEVTIANFGGVNIFAYIITNVIAFIVAALAYVIYIVMKTMVFALDILAFLFSPIPGSTAIFTIVKHAVLLAYNWCALTDPLISSIIGLICLAIAFLVFRKARRLELYYRKIYIAPFFNAIFRRGWIIPILPEKMPRGTAGEFENISVCVEAFSMNKNAKLYKRELCYFIRDGETNYIFKKRLFGKKIKVEVSGEIYVEKCFRFIRIFTDESLRKSQRKVLLVLRREQGKNIEELVKKANLTDYNLLIEERKRIKAEEAAKEKAQIKQEKIEKELLKKQEKEDKKSHKTHQTKK